MMRASRRELQHFDLCAAAGGAGRIASKFGVVVAYQIESVPPAKTLVLSSDSTLAAKIMVSDLGPGIVYLDIGVGMHGEWLLRSKTELHQAMSDFLLICEGVFQGEAKEDIRRLPWGRLAIRGSIKTTHKVFRFRHYAVGFGADEGMRCYAPYPSSIS